MGEGRGASKEHMELYKLFGAPRKTGKIIIYISETAHFSLQPSGTQTSRGQHFVQQNSHKQVQGKATEDRMAAGSCTLNTSGRKICWLRSWSWLLPPLSLGISMDSDPSIGMVTFCVILCTFSREKCSCAHPSSSKRKEMPRH